MGRKEPGALFARLLLFSSHLACELVVRARGSCRVGTCRQLTTRSRRLDIFNVIFVRIIAKFAWTTLLADFDRLADLTGYAVAAGVGRHPLLNKLLMKIRTGFVETAIRFRL